MAYLTDKDTTTIGSQFNEEIDLDWTIFSSSFRNVLDQVDVDPTWTTKDEIRGVVGRVSQHYAQDLAVARKELAYIFEGGEIDVEDQTKKTEDFINRWIDNGGRAIVAPAMAMALMEHFDPAMVADKTLVNTVMTAAVLAEVPSKFEYHSNNHFRKVPLHIARVMQAHNRIDSEQGKFHSPDFAENIVAAFVHDLAYDGRGNVNNRVHEFARQEKGSFMVCKPFLGKMGVSDQMLEGIRLSLIGTDVTPFADPQNPSNQVRNVFKKHFMSDDYDATIPLNEELKVLMEDSCRVRNAVALQAADITNSSSVSYFMTIMESLRVSREMGYDKTRAEGTLTFFDGICHDGDFLLDGAHALNAENFQSIKRRLVDDARRDIIYEDHPLLVRDTMICSGADARL